MGRDRLMTCLTAFVLAVVVGLSSVACLVTAFSMDTVSLFALAGWCILTAGVCCLCFGRKLGFIPLGILALLLGYLWQKGILLDSIESLLYEISLVTHKAYRWKILRWSYRTADKLALTLSPILYLLGSFLTLTVSWVVCRGQSAIPAVLAALPAPLCCLLVTDKVPHGFWLGLLLFGLAMLVIPSLGRQEDEKQGTRLTLYAALPVALAVTILFGCIPRRGYEQDKTAQAISDKLLAGSPLNTLWEELTGQSLTTQVASDGTKVDLTTVGLRHSNATQVLWVTSNFTGTVYLRSRALDTYDGKSWTDRGEGTNLLWPGEQKLVPAGEVIISSRYAHANLYLPYYTTSLDTNGLGRSMANEKKLTYYSIACSRVPDQFYFQKLYPNANNNPHVVSDELMEQCTYLPEATRQWAEPILDEILDGTASYYHIAQAIGSYVRSSAAYDLNTPRMPDGKEDFAQWFLTESDTGYCVHFATSAAVLLKAAGIPARYATGYLVDLSIGKTTVVDGVDAHAWVEYWLPGFGWTVLEATPGDVSAEPEPDPVETVPTTPEVTDPTVTDPAPTVPGPTAATQSTQPDTRPQDPASPPGEDMLLIWLLLGLLGGALTVCQWRIRVELRKKRLGRGNPNARVLSRWQYLSRLCRHTGERPDEALFLLAQKAKFSPHTMTQAELADFDRAIAKSVSRLKKRNLFLGLYYTLILALY